MKVMLKYVCVHCRKERTCTRRRTHKDTLSLIMPSDLVLPGSAAGGRHAQGRRFWLVSETLHSVCEVGSTYTHSTRRKRAREAHGQHFSMHCICSGQWEARSDSKRQAENDEDDSLPNLKLIGIHSRLYSNAKHSVKIMQEIWKKA